MGHPGGGFGKVIGHPCVVSSGESPVRVGSPTELA